MVKLVRNNMKQNIHSQPWINLKMIFMMIKLYVIHYMDKIKYYMNKKHMNNKNLVKIIWLH